MIFLDKNKNLFVFKKYSYFFAVRSVPTYILEQYFTQSLKVYKSYPTC